MNRSHTRKADQGELNQVYMMGFDVWGKGSEAEHLVACQNSPKYARGVWYVLEDENRVLASSLIVYKFEPNQYGLGSIATPKEQRKKGYASKLISDILQQIDKESPGASIFLYSDIEPKFYERFNFVRLPPLAQRYETTTCMVRGKEIEKFFSDKATTPEYF